LKILLLNQTFYPDTPATSYYLTDLAKELTARGHEVTVFTGQSGYKDASMKYPATETVFGARVHRLGAFFSGKKTKAARWVNFATFCVNLSIKLLFASRQDVVIGLTSPPLVAFLGAAFCRIKGGRFIYWVMDLNPDEAVAAGWLKGGSLVTRVLYWASGWTFNNSQAIVLLDRFMKDRVLAKSALLASKCRVIPPWSLDEDLKPVPHEANAFRRDNGLQGKFVVMFAGNHSPCHSLKTLLAAALACKDDENIIFYFVGNGSGVGEVLEFKDRHRLSNIRQLDHHSLDKLAEPLSAADLHVVVMGKAFVGIVHPCKIYNILAVGRPFVFIGPEESAMGDLVVDSGLGTRVAHGDAEGLVRAIKASRGLSAGQRKDIFERSLEFKARYCTRSKICGELADFIEGSRLKSGPEAHESH